MRNEVWLALRPSCDVKPATTHATGSTIVIPLKGGCTACASTTLPFIRFAQASVKEELTVYVEGGGGKIALPGIVITVEP